MRAPPDPAPRLLTPQVGTYTNLDIQVPAALSLTHVGTPYVGPGGLARRKGDV